jgi:hypothetical protein
MAPLHKTDTVADIFVVRELTFAEFLEEARASRRPSLQRGGPRFERKVNILEPGAMAKFLTPKRAALLELLAQQSAISLTDLAAALQRPKTAVARDVAALQKCDILRTELAVNPGHGRVTIVKPLARRYEFVWSIGAPLEKIAAKSSAKKAKRKAA